MIVLQESELSKFFDKSNRRRTMNLKSEEIENNEKGKKRR